MLAHAQPVSSLPELTNFSTPSISFMLQIGMFMAFVVVGTYAFAKFKQTRFSLKTKNKPSQLSILETHALGNRQYLLVVAYNQQKFLLNVHPNGTQYLCTLNNTYDKKQHTHESMDKCP
ncbi:MAG: flagellar biosynthetic protein FliO [Puniceicoccales bacterium]|jgi:flagellar biogenesis protein FliO|nr:flagellar biosynthetic protein FliO [Puniceicoccales bacterium]